MKSLEVTKETELRFSWDVRRDVMAQVLDIVGKLAALPSKARVREVVVILEEPVPQPKGGSYGGQ